jgi:hypothetical protein
MYNLPGETSQPPRLLFGNAQASAPPRLIHGVAHGGRLDPERPSLRGGREPRDRALLPAGVRSIDPGLALDLVVVWLELRAPELRLQLP